MDEHSKFVSTESGCQQYEIYLVKTIVALTILLRNLALPWIFLGQRFNRNGSGYWCKFLLDFFFLVLPIVLTLTVFANSLWVMVLLLGLCISTLILFVLGEFYLLGKHRPSLKVLSNKIVEEHHHPTTYVTFFRSMLYILTSVSILAVDFPIFPRRFSKTEFFGHSLMDTGVAAFLYADATAQHMKTPVMREKSEQRVRHRLYFLRSSSVVLLSLGVARSLVLYLLDYPQHVTEYGVHWNFFFTFAVVKFVSRVLPKSFHVLTGILFLVLHQTMLSGGYQEWILDVSSPRDTFFSANREGICSLMGYLALYYFASAIGKFASATGIRVRALFQCALHLLMLSVFFLLIQKGAEMSFGAPSRRVVNMPYIFSMLSVITFSLSLCLFVQVLYLVAWAARVPHFGSEDNPWEALQPCLLDSINRAGLAFFLFSNVLTGVVNMSIPTHHSSDVIAVTVLVGYMVTVCAGASWLVSRHQKVRRAES